MQYMKLDDVQREELFSSLAGMKKFLSEVFASLTTEETVTPGPDGTFSPVEQVWHLADLESEGFGLRIQKLQAEINPHLPDFDGDAIASARDYRSLSILDGLKAFEEARDANLLALQSLPAEAWLRNGTQEGVGEISLCDMPAFIQQHDRAHIAEIMAWKKFTVRYLNA
jgi:hypothetical protein